jgi:hypothetical protein
MGNAPPSIINVVLQNKTINITAKDSHAVVIITENKESFMPKPDRTQDEFAVVTDGHQINPADITTVNQLFTLLRKLPDCMYIGKRALASNYYREHSTLPTNAEQIELMRILGMTEYSYFQQEILPRTNQSKAIPIEANTVTIID